MSKRLTIVLSDEEYERLTNLAADERRSTRDMAAYIVAQRVKPAKSGTLTLTGLQGTALQQQYTTAAAPSFGLIN